MRARALPVATNRSHCGDGGAAARGHDLHLVAVLQQVAQRHQPAVHLGADAGVADLAVHGVGEVDRGGAARQLDQRALRREAEDLVLVELELGVLEEFVRSLRVLEDLEQVLHPAEGLHLLGRLPARRLLVLVDPVRRDAVLGHVVHVGGADLHLDLLVARLAQRDAGVQAAVAVRLRRADVVLEPARDHRERGMHRPERGVASLPRGDDDAERHDVGQLLERHVAALHLLPDGERRLLAPGDLDHVRAGLLADAGELDAHLLDHVGALAAQVVEPRLDRVVRLRLQLCEGERLQLGLHRVHADPLGERRIDVHGLARDALAAHVVDHVVQRAHVVQPVRELHQQHADVPAHRQHELAEVLGLLGAVGLQLEPGELGHAVDEARDFGPETALDVAERDRGVLDHVVQQAGEDAGGVEPVAGEDVGDRDRVGDVGVAVVPQLGRVRLGRERVGGLDEVGVGARVVPVDAARQLGRAGGRLGPGRRTVGSAKMPVPGAPFHGATGGCSSGQRTTFVSDGAARRARPRWRPGGPRATSPRHPPARSRPPPRRRCPAGRRCSGRSG